MMLWELFWNFLAIVFGGVLGYALALYQMSRKMNNVKGNIAALMEKLMEPDSPGAENTGNPGKKEKKL